MNPNHMQAVTLPATTPDPAPLERVEFHLSDFEREQAAKAQAALVVNRNAPMKRGNP